MKRFKILLLAAVVLLSAAGPGSFYAYKWYQDSQKKYQTVRVAESRPGVYKLPHYLALKKNFYRDQYVKVRQVDCLDDREALAALENGQADVALVNPSSLVFKRAAELKKGVGPLAFASLDLGTNYHLVARENKPLADMQSLKNKTVIAGTQDSLETMFLEITMREAGFNPYEAVTIITNIPPEIRLGALKAGTGHYLLLEEKDLPAALAGGLFPVKSFKAGFPSFVCVSARQFMDQQPEALQRLTNGLYLAQSWLRHHSPGEAASAVGSLEGLDKKELPGLVARYYEAGSLPVSPVINSQKLDPVIKMLDKSREIPMPVSGSELVAGQFADIAVKTVQYVPEDKQKKSLLQRLKFWK